MTNQEQREMMHKLYLEEIATIKKSKTKTEIQKKEEMKSAKKYWSHKILNIGVDFKW